MTYTDLDRNQIEDGPSVEAYRDLWCAVIGEQFRLAVAPPRAASDLEVRSARDWFGSRDFRIVCEMIGIEANWLNAEVQRIISSGGVNVPNMRLHRRSAEAVRV